MPVEMVNKTAFGITVLAVSLTTLASCRPVDGGTGAEAPAPTEQAQLARAIDVPATEAEPASSQTPSAPRSLSGQAELRSRLTADVVKGTVMRVDGAAQATPGSRLAGYLIRPRTERPLDQARLEELVRLIRSDTGFDDSIVKRCGPGISIGFRLFRSPPQGNRSPNDLVTDVVLDFGCEKLTLTESGAADEHATYFGPSRAAFVAFVKRVLPDDSELSRLR